MRMMILKSVFLPASLFPALSAGLPGCVSKQSTVRPFHRLGQQSLTSSRKPGLFRSRVRGSRRALQRSLEPGQGRRGPPARKTSRTDLSKARGGEARQQRKWGASRPHGDLAARASLAPTGQDPRLPEGRLCRQQLGASSPRWPRGCQPEEAGIRADRRGDGQKTTRLASLPTA